MDIVIPEQIILAVTALVAGGITYLVVEGLKGLFGVFKVPVEGKVAAFVKQAAALASGAGVSFVLGIMEAATELVPEANAGLVNSLLAVVVSIIAMGIHQSRKDKTPAVDEHAVVEAIAYSEE